MEIPKKYDPKEAEPRIFEFWQKEKVYSFDKDSKAEIFSIDTPPPTMSGKMHIGHAFSYSQQDFIARYQRMMGKSIFYPFGIDDNGLATIRMIEKMKNVKGVNMGRREFIDLCLKTLEDIRPSIVHDWKRIGVSADFNIFYSTISHHAQKISQKSFIDLHRKGRIYRKRGPFIWCPECQTAIAQVEMKDSERDSHLVYMKFDTSLGEQIVIATTRPELLPACVAIHIHPDDKRFKKFIGAQAKIPFSDRQVAINANTDVKMDFGSGIVYHCTYGDMDDVKWMEEFKIDPIEILNKDGVLNELAGQFKGLHVKKARKAVIEALKKENRIDKMEQVRHVVNVHERCETDIEILNTNQWYIEYLDLKDDFLEYGKRIKWYPLHMRVRYDNWVNGLRWDWNISRQRDFGIPIPVWYCKKCSEINLADEKQLPVDPAVDKPVSKCKCGSEEFLGEKDTLDTWATSSLSPQLAIELFEDKELKKKLFPMSLRPQAHDIITFWLFNTVVKSYFHKKSIPWNNIMISGFALDPKGKKMSKSRGNVVDPREMVLNHSADSLRFWAAGSRLGDDLPFQEKDLVTGDKFITKIWNASKFAFMHLNEYNLKTPKKLEIMDQWILSKLSKVIKVSAERFSKYEYSSTKLEVETFFWHTFCDNYLELIKDRIYNPDRRGSDAKLSAQYCLYTSLLSIVKLMAPIMPFITEEIYQLFFKGHEKSKSIHITKWPALDMTDGHAEHVGDFVVSVIEYVRKQKSQKKMSLKTPIKKLIIKAKIEEKDFDMVESDIKATTWAESIIFEPVRGKKTEKDLEISVEF